MFRLVLFLIAAAVLSYIAAVLADSGTITFRWRELEGSVPVGLLAASLGIMLFGAVVLYEFWRWLSSLPGKLRDNRQHRREVEGYQALASGMIAAAAGDALGARANARLAEKLLGDRSVNLLLTAQTAQLEGQEDIAQLKFKEMLRRPETEFLGLRGLLAEAVRNGDHETALELARRAYKRSPNTSWVLTTLFDLTTRTELWAEALGVVNDLARQQLASPREAARRRGLLNFLLAEEAMEEDRPDDAMSFARTAVKLIPDFAPAVVSASLIALETGRAGQARRFIEAAWRLAPHPELAAVFARIEPSQSPQERLERFERLAALNPNHALSHAVLAEVALAANALDEAAEHLDTAIGIDARAGHFRLYADLERARGGNDDTVRNWLERAIEARPDPQWVCEDTGEVLEEWRLFGPSGRFDCVRWETPPAMAELIRAPRTTYVIADERSSSDGTPELRAIDPPGRSYHID